MTAPSREERGRGVAAYSAAIAVSDERHGARRRRWIRAGLQSPGALLKPGPLRSASLTASWLAPLRVSGIDDIGLIPIWAGLYRPVFFFAPQHPRRGLSPPWRQTLFSLITVVGRDVARRRDVRGAWRPGTAPGAEARRAGLRRVHAWPAPDALWSWGHAGK